MPDDETLARTRTRTHAAIARLQATLRTVASDVVARIDERCPYRAREDRCTFAGGCVNQQRQRRERRGPDGGVQCGGDHRIRRSIR